MFGGLGDKEVVPAMHLVAFTYQSILGKGWAVDPLLTVAEVERSFSCGKAADGGEERGRVRVGNEVEGYWSHGS